MRDAYGFWLKAYVNRVAAIALLGLAAMGVGVGFAAAPASVPATTPVYVATGHHAHRDLSRQAFDENGGWQMDCQVLTPTTGTCWNVLVDGPGY